MSTKTKVIISVIVVLTSFAAGRFSTPVKMVTKIQTVEVEKKNEKTDTKEKTNEHKVTTISERDRPDGTVERTTVIDEQSGETKSSSSSDKVDTEIARSEDKETVRSSQPVTISALAGVQFSATSPILYGGAISKPVLGPVTIGVWGLSNATFGASVGLTL